MSVLNLSSMAHAEIPGFYVGAQLGYGNNHLNTTDLVRITQGSATVALPDLKHTTIAYGFSYGYQFNQNFAVEVGYRHFGETDIHVGDGVNYFAGASSQESAFDLLGKCILPIGKRFNIYGKLGIAYVKPHTQGDATTAGR